ncbi:MAG TPA: hypothetical protein VGQ76_28075 [Thermoanaerobaculia bacterium]|nr:hypothetical protein [Thermoanaerobaculia bacterium]
MGSDHSNSRSLAPGAVGARVETLYFDGPSELDWPAFAFAGEETYIVLDREHVAKIQV